MKIRFQNASADVWQADCALVFAFEKEPPAIRAPNLWKRCPWLATSPALRDFTGRGDNSVLLYGHQDLLLSRVLLTGLGKEESFSLPLFRLAVARAVRQCRAAAFSALTLPVEFLDTLVPGLRGLDRNVLLREFVVAARLCLYRCDVWRSARDEDEAMADPDWLSLFFSTGEIPDEARKAVRQGEAEAAGVALARNLGNAPANRLTPAELAEEARKLAVSYDVSCAVLDEETIRESGMGALLAVAAGARHKPRFIVLEHCPMGKEGDKPLVVAGKGITFDTGGICLKPAAKMHEMKGDMGGAAAVLGLFAAIGAMPGARRLPRIVGLIPAAENMPGGGATRPGDIVTSLSGKTVEILNTDAEGRLALCDALTYAQKRWTPAVLLDLATLTGACAIALGDYGSGLFTEDEELRRTLLEAAELSGDLVWPLPLWDDYDVNLKSGVADMTNTGPREGGAINAALFLRRFIDQGVRWAHLDIAGPGYVAKTSPLHPVAGGTGVGVRLLCRWLEKWSA